MYADDVVLYSDVLCREECSSNLQSNLDELLRWCNDWKMFLNIEKCAIMRMSRQKSAVRPRYYLNGLEVKVVQEFKYLGVHIGNTCSWQTQIKHVVGKGNKMLRFIKRNFRGCPQAVKETVYASLVRPLLEYACCVWDPSGEGLKHEIEMVQRRAARCVLNDYDINNSVNDMLSQIGWQVLEARRRIARLCFMFKLYHGNINIDTSSVMLEPSYVGRNDHRKKIRRLQSRLLPYHNSFFPKTIRDWNRLSTEIIEAESVMDFKNMFNE